MPNRILFVDDDPDTREMIDAYLKVRGFEVYTTGSSADALLLAREQKFDAYLIDNWMPEMSGIELCSAIRQFDSNPIIFYSGAAQLSDSEEARFAGANCYLAKPVDPDELLETLRSAIENRPVAQTEFQVSRLDNAFNLQNQRTDR